MAKNTLEPHFLTKEKVFCQLQEVLEKAFVYFGLGYPSESKYCNNQKKYSKEWPHLRFWHSEQILKYLTTLFIFTCSQLINRELERNEKAAIDFEITVVIVLKVSIISFSLSEGSAFTLAAVKLNMCLKRCSCFVHSYFQTRDLVHKIRHRWVYP